MKKLFLVLFILASLTSLAQSHFIGSTSGVLLSKSNYNDAHTANTTLEFLPSFTTRITYDYKFASNFTFGVDAAYQQMGSKNMLDNSIKIEQKADFISLPIKFGYQTGGQLFVFSNLGLATSFLLKNQRYSYYPEDYNTPIGGNDLLSQYSRVSVNAFVELGIGYRLNDDIDLNMSGGFQHDIIPLYSTLSSLTLYHRAFNISLGFRLRIANKS